MSDDPAHKAMLYFLEILMNSNGALSISQLAGRFGSRSFSSEMRTACGGNEAGLKKFLLKFPSLFMLWIRLFGGPFGTFTTSFGSFADIFKTILESCCKKKTG